MSGSGRCSGKWLETKAVPRGRVVVDGGVAFETARGSPRGDDARRFTGKVRWEPKVVRAYAHSVRARTHRGDGWRWSEPGSFHPGAVRWDSVASGQVHEVQVVRHSAGVREKRVLA